MTLSLWAVPVNANYLKEKYKSNHVPHVVLSKNVSNLELHKSYPKKMRFSVRHKDMMVRHVGSMYEYGWVLKHEENPVFMVCHETKSTDEKNVLRNGVMLEQSFVEADVLYSLGGFLVEPCDIAHIMNNF